MEVSNNLPTFHTRQMQKDFIEKYSRAVKTTKSVFRYIYQDLTGDATSATTEKQQQKRDQI